MNITPEDIRRNYSQLSDPELMEIDRASLTPVAQKIWDAEVSSRGLPADGEPEAWDGQVDEAAPPSEEDWADAAIDEEETPDWIDDAAVACSFAVDTHNPSVGDVVAARKALSAVGIPCHVTANDVEATETSRAFQEYCVMVPGALTLHATAVIDKAIFNPRQEAVWRSHLEALSNEDLGALNPDIFCAGLLDRVARLKKTYNEEVARRAK